MTLKSHTLKALLVCSIYISTYSISYAHGEKSHENNQESFDAVTTEFGQYDPDLKPSQTIEVSMADTMRFTPSEIEVKAGDVVKFIVKNDGAIQHEFVLGTTELLLEHAELMMKHPNMEHEEPYMAHVDPGKEMEIIWQFTESGTFEFGCLLPGHFQAGMKGTVKVI